MVRSTINPSSAIQRRCHAPHVHNAETTATVIHSVILVSGV
jgi:hypothetical protein